MIGFYDFANLAEIPVAALHRAVRERRVEHYYFGPEGSYSQDHVYFDADKIEEVRELYRVPAAAETVDQRPVIRGFRA